MNIREERERSNSPGSFRLSLSLSLSLFDSLLLLLSLHYTSATSVFAALSLALLSVRVMFEEAVRRGVGMGRGKIGYHSRGESTCSPNEHLSRFLSVFFVFDADAGTLPTRRETKDDQHAGRDDRASSEFPIMR